MRPFSKHASVTAALAGFLTLVPGCFTGAESNGLPCISNEQCAKDVLCTRGFCGGPTVPSENWGPCIVEGCAPGEVCGEFGSQYLSCGPGCSTDTECTAFIWEGWQLICSGQQTGNPNAGVCMPACDLNLDCPVGRDCVNFGGRNVCAWWQSSM